METHCQYLTMTQRYYLLKLLQKFEELFDGTLGTYKTDQVYFYLGEDANQLCSQPYPVPKLHDGMFKNEVECLVILGVLKVKNYSEWVAP